MLDALLTGLRAIRRRDLVLIVLGGAAAGLVLATILAAAEPFHPFSLSIGQDSHAYWAAQFPDPYPNRVVVTQDFYPYSPAFLQALAPIRWLPWPAFAAAWAGVLLLALLVLVGPRLFIFGFIVALPDIVGGNIHLLLALTVVAGLRWSGAWAFPLLTKITPGIGLIWFPLRREWRALAIALGFTGAIVAVSFVLQPAAWVDYVAMLVANLGVTADQLGSGARMGSIGLPFAVRLPVAIVLIVFGARTDRGWLMPVAAMLAQPVLWFGGLAMLLGIVPFVRGASWVERGRLP